MSIKCNKCNNNIFDANAYLKISIMKFNQQDKVNELKDKLENTKREFGKKSEQTIEIQRMLNIENRILNVIMQCQNTL